MKTESRREFFKGLVSGRRDATDDMAAVWAPAPGSEWAADGERLSVRLNGAQVLEGTVPVMAVRASRLMDGRRTATDVVDALVAQYGCTRTEAVASLRRLLNLACRSGVLVRG
jgi:hypothetical protein